MQNDRVKSAQELALMRRAAAVTDDVYDCLLASVREGVTERELADLILRETLRLGAEGVSFDTIVAFGESGAEPHHVPTDKRLEHGMLVTVDMGAVVGGYCSDFTRTLRRTPPRATSSRLRATQSSTSTARDTASGGRSTSPRL